MAELQTKPQPGSVPVEPEPPLAEAPPPLVAAEKKAVPALPPAPAAPEETKALAVVENESEFLFFCV